MLAPYEREVRWLNAEWLNGMNCAWEGVVTIKGCAVERKIKQLGVSKADCTRKALPQAHTGCSYYEQFTGDTGMYHVLPNSSFSLSPIPPLQTDTGLA